MADSNPWNAAEITLIRRLWAADWSAGKIAKELGSRTRNAVIGFASRNRDICPGRRAGHSPIIRELRHAKGQRPKAPSASRQSTTSVRREPSREEIESAKADLYRMLRRAVLNTGGRP